MCFVQTSTGIRRDSCNQPSILHLRYDIPARPCRDSGLPSHDAPCKMIVAQLPTYTGSAWDLMRQVPFRDMLLFVDEFPGFYRATSPLPPYSVPPPPFPHDFSSTAMFTTPPPARTPQYTPASPDDNNSGYSAGLNTFPPTPLAPPPCMYHLVHNVHLSLPFSTNLMNLTVTWNKSSVRHIARYGIIDFPNLGLTYNGGWCSATKTR